jgi:16S rRNA (cytosine1402-N4)-methyltransferase
MAVHVPVMPAEVMSLLEPSRGGVFVDCTVGLGGHARLLMEGGASRLVGLDRDCRAIDRARETLAPWAGRVDLVHADYREVGRVLDELGLSGVDGVLADLGVSSMQLDEPGRGFSFNRDEPLDMRMDTSQGPTAAELIARVDESELADVIYQFGEERRSRAVARAIVAARERQAITTTGQLASIVRRVVGRGGWQRIDPATRTFQAIRIWVNRELDSLDTFARTASARLAVGGRFAVISFHSLEDRVFKFSLKALAQQDDGAYRLLTKKPLVAGDDETGNNPRARSAKLRGLERLG